MSDWIKLSNYLEKDRQDEGLADIWGGIKNMWGQAKQGWTDYKQNLDNDRMGGGTLNDLGKFSISLKNVHQAIKEMKNKEFADYVQNELNQMRTRIGNKANYMNQTTQSAA